MARPLPPLIRCFALYRPHLRLFIITTAVAMLVNLSMPFTQYIIGLAIDELNQGLAVVRLSDGSLDFSRAWWWAAFLIGVIALRGVVQYIGQVMSIALGQRVLHDLRSRLLWQVQRLDQAYHLQHGTGELVTRTTRDSDKIRDAVVGGWRTMLETCLIMLACLGMLAWYHPMLALVPTILVFAGVWWFVAQARQLVVLDRSVGDAYDVVTQELAEGVGGVRVIKSFALEDVRVSTFAGYIKNFTDKSRLALRFSAWRLPLPQILVGLSHVWILWYGALLVGENAITVGSLVAALMVVTGIIFRVENVGRTMQMFAEAEASAQRVMELLDAEPAIRSGSKHVPADSFGVQFSAIDVVSPTGAQVLHGFNLTLAPGEIVAVVGMTGCGKSTLAHLLPRLRDPLAGAVSIGDEHHGWTDIRELDLRNLRRHVQVVYQDSFLFSDTVRANLLHGRPDADESAIQDALTAANAHDIIAGLAHGLDTIIGERGATLSGGQRQRLCLARALIARPAVLCLDDATSALDAVTERHILDNLRRATPRPTVLVIASKLATILLADRVVLLENGHVAASGKHQQLLETAPAYRSLLGLQP